MTTTLGVVMDPIDTINPRKDSTFAMLLAAQRRGFQLRYLTQGDLYAKGGEVWARQRSLTVRDDEHDWFELGEGSHSRLDNVDVLLMRKDPPFDMEFIYTTYLLEIVARQGVLVLNNPRSIRDCNEKLFALQFPQCCPPLLVSRDQALLASFHGEHQDVIFKPLDGMGGASIFRIDENGTNLGVVLETLTNFGTRQIMAQRYIPEIVDGDTRILMINGEPVPYGLARIPQGGETRGNLAAGGVGVGRPLTDHDRWICDQVGPTLAEKGLAFVGIDVIGDYLTEINVTCPTCIREIDKAFDLDIAGMFMDYIGSKLGLT